MAQDTTHTAQHAERTPGEQEPIGPGFHTHSTTHRAYTSVNRSQVAEDTMHTAQHTEQADW